MSSLRRGGAVLMAVLCAACSGRAPAPRPSPAPPASRHQRASATPVPFKVTSRGHGSGGVVLTERRRGRTIYVLHADANVSNRFGVGTGTSVFTKPHIVFSQPQGKTLTADAPTASVEEESKTVVMSGGVRARTQDGIALQCDELRYDDAAQKIHGRGNVVVTTPHGESLSGDTLDADVDLNHVRVSGAGA